jgi:hypothetical protein
VSKDRFKQIKGTEKLVRKRRGAFNSVREISKILFGTLDSDDAEYYTKQINHFKDEYEDMTSILNQQLSLIKASSGTVLFPTCSTTMR